MSNVCMGYIDKESGEYMYLVLGGTGLIGRSLVKRLCKKNRVRVLARKETDLFSGFNVEMIYEDIQTVDFNMLLRNVDCVFHLISSSVPIDGVERIKADIIADYIPTISLLDAMVNNGVSKIFFISSGGTVYGDRDEKSDEKTALAPKCTYGLSKVYIEECLSLYQRYCMLDCFVLRVGNPYGIDRSEKKQGIIPIFVRKISQHEEIEIWGDGTNERDYIFVEEVVDAIEAVEKYKGNERVFNIGTGIGISTVHILSLLCESLDKNVNIKFKPARLCDVNKARMDVELIERECGWKSRISIEDGIKIYLDEWRETL